MPSSSELVELERRFWLEASEELYRERMAADGLMAFSIGVLGKAETIEAVAAADPWTEVAFDDVRTVELAADAVALVYRATGRRAGQDAYTAVVVSVYARRGGEWQVVLHQQTPLG
jgi:Domain of unknown function (DUF4440)